MTLPGIIPSPSDPGLSSLESKSIWKPIHIPRNGLSVIIHSLIGSNNNCFFNCSDESPNEPTPGKIIVSILFKSLGDLTI